MVEINWDVYKQNAIITGAAQHGKTNCGKVFAKMLQLNKKNILVRDPHRRFTNVDASCVKTHLGEMTGKGLEIYQPIYDTDDDFRDTVSWVNRQYNLVFMPDELHNYCKKQKAPKELDFMCRNCNNRSIGYIAIFQAPAEVPNYVLRNSNHRFCYFLDVPTDIDYMMRFIGIEVKRFAADSLDPVAPYTALYKEQGKRVEEFYVEKFD